MHSHRLALLLSITTLPLASAGASAAQPQPHGSALAPTTPAALRAGRDDKLRRLLTMVVAQTKAPGGVLFVQTPTGTWRRAMGAARLAHSVGGPAGARRRLPMRVSSRFRIASVTKTLTAALVLRLVADRTLSLDDRVEHWLPDGSQTAPVRRSPSAICLDTAAGSRTRGATARSSSQVHPVASTMRTPTTPCCVRPSALSVGPRIADALAARILQPLGLKAAELATWAQVPAGLAHGYSVERDSRGKCRDSTDGLANANDPAAAGLVSAADDLARFERGLLTGKLIPSELVALMETPEAVEDSDTLGYNAYGLGMMRFSAPCGAAWGHRGRPAGYTSYLLSTANGKRTVVLLI